LDRVPILPPTELLHERGSRADALVDDHPFDAVDERLTAAPSAVHRLNSDFNSRVRSITPASLRITYD
jgi:hypothetical protein